MKLYIEELKKKAEAAWEGCHGCDESDKDMWINGYIKGALANQIELPTDEDVEKELQTEISDEEIYKASHQEINHGGGSEGWIKAAFRQGAVWYREQLKKK